MKLSNTHTLVIATLAIATLSPIPLEFKIVTSLSGAGVSGHLAISEREKFNKRKAAEKAKTVELELSALNLDNRESLLEADLRDLNLIRQQHENQLAAQKEKQLIELTTLEQTFNQELKEKEENLKHALKLQQDKEANLLYGIWLDGCDRLVNYAKELSDIASESEHEYEQARTRLARLFKGLRSRLYAKNTRKLDEMLLQFEMSATQVNEFFSETITSKITELNETIHDEGVKRAEEIEAGGTLLEDLVKEKLGKVEDEIVKVKKRFEKTLAEYVYDTNIEQHNLTKQILELREDNEYLRGKLNKELKPILIRKPRTDGDRKTNDFLNWLFQNWGVVAEHNSSAMGGDRVLVVNFDLLQDQDSLSKKIKRLNSKDLPAQLQAYFGCESEPTIGLNVELGCWIAVIPPTQGGSTPRLDDAKFAPASLPRPAAFDSLEAQLREQIEAHESFEQMERFMLDFVPVVPLPLPTEAETNNQELNTIRWFFLWRRQASDGQLEDIVTAQGLLREVYGLTDGNFFIEGTKETLTQRVERLMQTLRMEMVDFT